VVAQAFVERADEGLARAAERVGQRDGPLRRFGVVC
jgi:hypothetical protein